MIFNSYLIIQIPILEENSDFYEIQVEAGGDCSAAWCEMYFPSQAMEEFYRALTAYAPKYEKPLNYDLNETVSLCFSPFTGTGAIKVDICMNKRNGDFRDGYSEITVYTDITAMDAFISSIGRILNRNDTAAYLGLPQHRFI